MGLAKCCSRFFSGHCECLVIPIGQFIYTAFCFAVTYFWRTK